MNAIQILRRSEIGFFLLALLALSCSKEEDSNTLPYKQGEQKSFVVPQTGGTIDFPNIISMDFKSGTFTKDQNVKITQVLQSNDIQTMFDQNKLFYGVKTDMGYFVKITLTSENPKKDIEAKFKLPDNFFASKSPDYSFEAMAALNQSTEEEAIFNFDVIPSKLVSDSKELLITVPMHYFSLSSEKKYEAVFTVATLLGHNKMGRIAVNDDCGFYIRCPLQTCTVTSPFDPERVHPTEKNEDGTPVIRPHRGVDFRAAANTQVFAVYDGEVIGARTMNGYGKVIDISHVNSLGQRFATRYAHLTSFNVTVGTKVKEGDQIALSGNTGTSSGPHLHFEYFVNGNINDRNANVDPVPFINTQNIRLVSAAAKLSGINTCSNNTRSPWDVVFDYKDPSNQISPQATLTFQDIEPVLNPPYTVDIGSLTSANGLVRSPEFCAHFGDYSFFRVKVFLRLPNGTTSNCIYFILNREGGALRIAPGQSTERPSSSGL